ncbi:hypothetical protein PIIN_03184 [Serendipita indica DSM 11827]|uniref:Uncharacterized protein n=1 Tax=Serendipita indica (strain DSM 11827) TaxID=1109443 RepID=G4TD73_SERID|nr:hypothetical protein PIIN_03184 [Serendipita indica DSM 11827]
MTILFEPPLSLATTVRSAIAGEPTVDVTFHATVPNKEWQRLNGSLEIWSNLPITGVRPGEWHPVAFEQAESAPDAQNACFVLCVGYDLPVPANQATATKYSYTYRIKHSAKDITWLGSYSSNGTIKVDKVGFWNPVSAEQAPCLGSLHQSGQWTVWCIPRNGPPRPYRLEDLGTNVLSAHNLVLVPTQPKWKLTYSAFLLFTSSGEEIKLMGREVFCDTPSTVSVECRCSMSAVLNALERNGVSTLPTVDANALFVSSNDPHAISSEFNLVKLGALPSSSTPIHVLPSKLTSLMGGSTSLVMYQPGMGPQLLTTMEELLPIFIKPNLTSFRLSTLHSIPCAPKQLVGVLTPALLHPVQPDSPHTSTLTIVGDNPTNPSKPINDSANSATLTLSRPRTSRVLFAQTVRIPTIITRRLGWIAHLPFITSFCHVGLYIVALVLPRFGLSFSLQWNGASSQQHVLSPKGNAKSLVASPKSPDDSSPASDADTASGELEFEVEPVDGEVQVVLYGDAADSVTFTMNREKVDPWTVVQTSHGERLHQFTISTNIGGILGVIAPS